MPEAKETTPYHIWKSDAESHAIKAGGRLTGERNEAKDRRLMELYRAGHSADIAGLTLARESHTGYETHEHHQPTDVRSDFRKMMTANAAAGGSSLAEAKGEWHPYGNPNAKGMPPKEKAQRVARLLARAAALRKP